jgi:hypothetical protein
LRHRHLARSAVIAIVLVAGATLVTPAAAAALTVGSVQGAGRAEATAALTVEPPTIRTDVSDNGTDIGRPA